MNKNYLPVEYTLATVPPALLFTGQNEQTLAAVEELLQIVLCSNNNCKTCISCIQIRTKQHHAIMWLHPEKNYTLDQLEDLFAALTFQQEPGKHFFFIIQRADFLPAACANKLLKPMEEPPAGYHFILLAEHPEHILPTIKSRCIIHLLNTTTPTTSHPLLDIFTQKITSASEFSKILDAVAINERESIELFDQILYHWLKMYQDTHDQKYFYIIQALQKIQLQLPMPGSSIIFWRNVHLQTHHLMTQSL